MTKSCMRAGNSKKSLACLSHLCFMMTLIKKTRYYVHIFFITGDIEEAVQNYRKAFSLDTHHSGSMVNAARGLRQLGKLNEAETILDRYVC